MSENEELESELNALSEENKELAEHLFRLADQWTTSRRTFKPKPKDIDKRIEEKIQEEERVKGKLPEEKRILEKSLLYNETRKELKAKSRTKQRKMVSQARKLLKADLTDNLRHEFGIKNPGRPQGSKSKNNKYSKTELNARLEGFIRNYFKQEGEEPTQQLAAKALGLGYAKKLQRLRQEYGDREDWRGLVKRILNSEE